MSEKPLLLFDREIQITAPLSGYRLVPGSERPLGLPIEAFLQLYAVNASGHIKLMKSLLDVLALAEEVRSVEEAIQLLRLETAPETHFLFPNSNYLDIRAHKTLERVGDMTDDAALLAGHRPSSSEIVQNGFALSRDLLRLAPRDKLMLVRRSEILSQTGQYRLIHEIEINQINPSQIILPDYE